MLPPKPRRLGPLLGLALCLGLALAGCQGGGSPVAPAALQQWLRTVQTPAPAAQTPDPAPATTPTDPATEGAIPVALTIPAIGLEAEVAPMGWEPAVYGDQITTRWIVPLDGLGWAVNSAAAGAEGNVVIIGHQALGSALLRPLALGEVAPGQEITLRAADGTTYLYQVSEVSPPIPAIGATAEETARAAAYLAPATRAILTLVSGWPADTTTHRVFVVAEYAGKAP